MKHTGARVIITGGRTIALATLRNRPDIRRDIIGGESADLNPTETQAQIVRDLVEVRHRLRRPSRFPAGPARWSVGFPRISRCRRSARIALLVTRLKRLHAGRQFVSTETAWSSVRGAYKGGPIGGPVRNGQISAPLALTHRRAA